MHLFTSPFSCVLVSMYVEKLEMGMRLFLPGERFRQEKGFANFTTCSHWGNFYLRMLLFCVNDYIEDMATFTALAKIYSTNYFHNTKENFFGYTGLYSIRATVNLVPSN